MKALTLWQPWATLVAMGEKSIETRCWKTAYRGPLAIHSAARIPPKWLGVSSRTDPFRDALADVFGCRRDRDERSGRHVDDVIRGLPMGKILCIVKLTGVEATGGIYEEEVSDKERLFGNYELGRYAWFLEMLEVIEPAIPVKGNRMLWNWRGRP